MMNHNLKITFALFISLFCGTLHSQPTAFGGNTGNWIIISASAARGNAYLIERSTDGSNWEQAARVLYPGSRAEMDARLLEINGSGMNLPDAPGKVQLDYLWRMMEKAAPADSFVPFSLNYAALYAAGMAWYDDKAPKNTVCRYRISRTDRSGRPVSTTGTVSASWPGKGPATTFLLMAVQPMKNGNSFEMTVGPITGITHFRVFRSYHLRTGFEPVRTSLLIRRDQQTLHLSIFDPTTTPEVLYAYYVVPYDAAGNPGTPSEEVKIFSVPDKSIQPSVRGLKSSSDNRRRAVRLSWRLNDISDIVSVDIFKGFQYDGKYAKLISLPPTDTFYLDYDVEPIKTYYYTVVLNGAYEMSPTSPRVAGMLEATDPNLLPPQFFTAEYSMGRVKLNWTKLEKDTRGYHVYRSVAGSDDWKKVKSIYSNDSAVTAFDTLPVAETGQRYAYFVTDLNTSYNESPASFVETIFAPGTSSLPAPGELTATPQSDGSVRLIWTNTARESAFVSGYHVYRNVVNAEGTYSGEWKQLNSSMLAEEVNMWTDRPAAAARYVYVVRSIAADGSLSKASPEAVFVNTAEKRLNVSAATVFSSSDGAMLNWTAPMDPELQTVEIWKSETGKESKLIHSAAPGTESYTDKEVKPGTGYLYTIRCRYSNGEFSDFTEAGTIRR